MDCDGNTPLSHASILYEYSGVAKSLLDHRDIDPNRLGWGRRTPLSLAAETGNLLLVELLLERPDVNPVLSDCNGRTPLSYAAENGCEDVVKLLLERGDVNSDSSDRNGLTPLSYATRSNYFGTIRLLSKQEPPSHETPQNSGSARQTLIPALRAQEEVGLAPLSQQESVIPAAGHEINKTVPLVNPDEPLSNQLEACPSSSILPPTHTSDPSSGSTILNSSRPPKRPGAPEHLLSPSKRKYFPSS